MIKPKKKYNVAVVGASGTVGAEILNILFERHFPLNRIHAIASEKSIGREVEVFDGTTLYLENLEDFNFNDIDIVLASAGAYVSEKYLSKIANEGPVIIDNSSYFRTNPLIPLIIPEVNQGAINNYQPKNIIANPNCSTIAMLVALAPLHRVAKIKRIIVTTYQSVSGAGREASNELFNQTRDIYNGIEGSKNGSAFQRQIAFNIIPQIDVFMEDGYTKEEWKMAFETQKILNETIQVSATCVRVPVFIGHSLALNVEFAEGLSPEKAIEILANEKAVEVALKDKPHEYFTPLEASGTDKVMVSRIREDFTNKNTLNMWVVADNLRKGAALNGVQIAELLINSWQT